MWFPVHQEVTRHPKTKKLSRILKISNQEAVGYLIFLWSWACDYAKDGILEELKEEIEDGCDWRGEPSVLLDALIQSRFIIDTEEVGLVINDWDEYGKKCFDKKQQNNERQKKYREKKSNGDITVMSQESNNYVTVTSPLNNATDKIREDKKEIREDKKKEDDDERVKPHHLLPEIPYKEIMESFNEIAISFPKTITLTANRKAHLKSRWREDKSRQNIDFWRSIFQRMENSDFISGRSGKWDKASFDWIIKSEDNLIKLLEGNYDNKGGNGNGKTTEPERRRQYTEEELGFNTTKDWSAT